MSLHEELLRTSDMCSNILWDFDFGSSKAQEGNHPAVPFEPSLDQLVLVTERDPCHLLDLRCTVPPPLHVVQGPEPEPDHPALLVDC